MRSYESVRAEVARLGRTLLTTKAEYRSVKDICVLCPCGEQVFQPLGSLRKTKGCKYCYNKRTGESKRHSHSFVKAEFEKQGWQLLESEYLGCDIPMKAVCPRGHETWITWSHLQKGQGCYYCQRENQRGEGHWNWNPNLTQEEREGRKDPRYTPWRDAVYKRDDYTCQACGDAKGSYLNAHHIRNFSSYEPGRYDPANGITLCSFCHDQFHELNTRENNDQAQLDEFITLKRRNVL